MTKGKPPFDPFAPGERTVIKPNPGGRRQETPGSGTAPPPQQRGSQTPGDMWGGNREAPGMQQWGAPSGPPPQMPPQQRPPSRPAADVAVPDLQDQAVTSGPNLILDAARPLLLLLSNVRIARQMPLVAPLLETAVKDIEAFEGNLRAKGLDEQQVRMAKYIMCATADDIVQNLPSTDRQIWTQYSMLSRYFGIRDSGVGFFDELAKLKTNPTLNFDLLALMHACLSLGFEGKYRVAGGDVQLQQIRRDLYQMLRNFKPRVSEDIGPHWRGQDIPSEHVRHKVPMWALGAGALGVLLLSFMVFRWLLGGSAEATATNLATIHPQGEILLVRPKFQPMEPVVIPETTQLERIRQALAKDISENRLAADYAGKNIVVRLLNDSAFEKGSAAVRDPFVTAIGHVSQALDKEMGEIRVVGHSDDTPLKSTVKFKDNQDLSEQRAKAVALLMLPGISDPKRFMTEGLGDTDPLDPAKTPEARAKNRRVEIFIPRDDL